MKHIRSIITNANMLPELIKLNLKNDGCKVIVNYWQPGFYRTANNKKSFHPTDSIVSAATKISANSYRFYNKKQKSKHTLLDIIHPGHISLETVNTKNRKLSYLSIGTGDPVSLSSFHSQCKMIAVENFQSDCLGLKRFPDVRVPFFSLDVEKSLLATEQILEEINKETYSLLGQVGDLEGKNCATAVYYCLVASGFRILVDFDPSIIGLLSDSIGAKAYIPETLIQLVSKSGQLERDNAKNDDLYLNFESESKAEQSEFVDLTLKLNEARKIEEHETNETDNRIKP